MKRTELERYDREAKRIRKKEETLQRKMSRAGSPVGDYINELSGLFFHDEVRIYNINQSTDILEFLEDMKVNLGEEKWETVLRKAVKKTNVTEKEEAIAALKELADIGHSVSNGSAATPDL